MFKTVDFKWVIVSVVEFPTKLIAPVDQISYKYTFFFFNPVFNDIAKQPNEPCGHLVFKNNCNNSIVFFKLTFNPITFERNYGLVSFD